MTDLQVFDHPLKTPEMRLDGQRAIVTGAGRGIGKAASHALAQAGAEVICISRTGDEVEAVAAEIIEDGGSASTAICDLTDTDQLVETFATLGPVDILVNNAGINIPEPLVEVTEEHYDRIMSINVKAAFIASREVAKRMIDAGSGGSIINMSSQMGHVGAATRTVYCTSKWAMEGMTKAMAVELAPHKIRVNAIGPTFLLTPASTKYFENPEFKEDTFRRIPMGELAKYEDIMGSIVFLASPAAALITGASLTIDGGWTAV